MEAKDWIDRWETGRIGFHQATVHPKLAQFASRLSGLEDRARVLVPLCGKSLDMTYLREVGYEVVGVELSELAARAYFDERGLTPDEARLEGGVTRLEAEGVVLLCGDMLQVNAEMIGPIHAVYDRAALVALPAEIRSGYVEILTALIPDGAPVLLICLEYPQEDMDGPPFSVPEAHVRQLFQGNFDLELLASEDVLATNPRFHGRVGHLRENTYLLTGRAPS